MIPFSIQFTVSDSIYATDVDPVTSPGSLLALACTYSIASCQISNGQLPYVPSGAYNAELVKPLSPKMQAKIRTLKTGVR